MDGLPCYRSRSRGGVVLDNQLIALIISTIIAGEAVAGIEGTPIKQAFQPIKQGVNVEPTAYLHKISDKRYGYPSREEIWVPETETMEHKEVQQYETKFQISALATQDPKNENSKTASDILNLIAYILQSDTTVSDLQSQGVGILRVENVRNPYFLNEKGRYEASPSLDFVLTHKQIITSTSLVLSETELNIINI